MKEYVATERGRQASNDAKFRYIRRHPDQRRAHVAVGNAVRDGLLVQTACQCCGAPDVEGHHPDYSRPLDVIWLCVPHHNQLHAEFF